MRKANTHIRNTSKVCKTQDVGTSSAPPPLVHFCKPWESTGVVRQGTGAKERVSSVVRALLVSPVRAVGPG